MLSGVSLTNEKSYLIGKFARLALHTANLDYNGRFCMVSAGAGNKKALGIDRNANPWSDIPLADVVWVAGSNVAETFPITTSYVWRARDRGAKLIVQDPRVVPLARTADLFLAGAAGDRLGAVRRRPARADPPRLARPRVHRRPHGRLRRGRRRSRRDDAGVGGRDHRRAGGPHRAGGRVVGHVGDGHVAPRPRHRAAHQGRRRTSWRRSTSGWPPASSASRAAACRRSPVRATARAAGSTATSATSSPATGTSRNPEHRAHVAAVWGCDESEIPGKGITAQEIIEAIHAGEIKGLLSICFNPAVSAPDANLTAEALDRLEFYAVIDFFLSETAHHADVVLPGSLHEEDEGTVDER